MLSDNYLIFVAIAAVCSLFFLIEYIRSLKSKDIKKITIIVISIVLICWLDFFSFLLLLFFSSFLLAIIKSQINLQKQIYALSLFFIFVLLAIKDYWILFKVDDPYIPLGLSYYFFRLLSLLIDYSKVPGRYKDIRLIDYFTYVFFFPIFLAGPIQRFSDFKELENITNRDMAKYYGMFLFAFTLKILIVDSLLYSVVYKNMYPKLVSADLVFGSGLNEFVYISLFSFFAFLHAYLDLMLYTEMSKAISRILGFGIQENFNKPLLATNISKFWQSWHMSLSNWTRDYIFFPTLLKTKKVWISTYASMMVIGIWHNATLNWIVWALLHASALNIYGEIKKTSVYSYFISNKNRKRFLGIIGNIATIYFVSIVFIFVAIHDFSKALSLFISLF